MVWVFTGSCHYQQSVSVCLKAHFPLQSSTIATRMERWAFTIMSREINYLHLHSLFIKTNVLPYYLHFLQPSIVKLIQKSKTYISVCIYIYHSTCCIVTSFSSVFPDYQVWHLQALEAPRDPPTLQESDPSDWSRSIQWPPQPQHAGALRQPPHTGAITCLRVPQQAAGAVAAQQSHWDSARLCLPPRALASTPGPGWAQEVGFHLWRSIRGPRQSTVPEPGHVWTEGHSQIDSPFAFGGAGAVWKPTGDHPTRLLPGLRVSPQALAHALTGVGHWA